MGSSTSSSSQEERGQRRDEDRAAPGLDADGDAHEHSPARTSLRKSTTRTRARWAEAPPSPSREGVRRGRLCNLGRGSAAGRRDRVELRSSDGGSCFCLSQGVKADRTHAQSREPGSMKQEERAVMEISQAPGGASLYADPESPYFYASRRHGVQRYSFYNHMYHPRYYGDPVESTGSY